MSLVKKDVPTSTVDVPVQVPGEKKPSTIQAEWKLHDWPEYRAIADALQAGEKSDDDVLEDLKNITGIKGEDKKDLPFDDELVSWAMRKTYVRRPLIISWYAAQEGRSQAAAKN
ncbi:hypothetical protein [Vreelandella venusta]|uniref:hypothetical protein n=1 Tax=Vreelandella venusta TaxID=44935 RepID=UPI0018DA834F|nr:hypothetical protein [Halomonas venusta]QPI65884.1 hypothetical protein IR195_09390 [Halomonas venusta]